MATMIPDEILEFTTQGEESFYQFIKHVALPDSKNLVWYTPDVDGIEPDFIMFSKDLGLVVFEVKDWDLEQICYADGRKFTLNIGGRQEDRKNPFLQAKDYLYQLVDKLRSDKTFVSTNPESFGKIRIPINAAVVFPNIVKYNYIQKKIDTVIPVSNILFWDDLHPTSDICTDTTGNVFRVKLQTMFPTKFHFSVTGKDMDSLRRLIFPIIKIEVPSRPGCGEFEKQRLRLVQLDKNQEEFSRSLGGHQIVKGPAGSGKTLVLVHQAAMLLRYNAQVKRLLFVCYNLSLVNYVRRLLAAKGVPLGPCGVEVIHFYELCGRIIGDKVRHEGENVDYYELVTQMALEAIPSCNLKYHAVLVDEGQDFSDAMLRLCTGLLDHSTDVLTVALDDRQDIYRRRRSWQEIGVKAKGRIKKLSYAYRNSHEIAAYARAVLCAKEEREVKTAQMELSPRIFGHHGPEPEISSFAGSEELIEFIAKQAAHLQLIDGVPFSEMAVLYVSRKVPWEPSICLPKRVRDGLESHGLLVNWMSEDYRSKRAYDVTTDNITVSTIHSAKGLDYDTAFLVGLEALDDGRWDINQIDGLLYVGLTRARRRLYIATCGEGTVVSRLLFAKNK